MDRTTFEKYFKTNTKSEVIFTGDDLKIYIPMRYAEKQMMTAASDISTVAIFRMVVNDKDEIKFKETRNYVKKVNDAISDYQK